jgi:hypothetical protein
MSKRPVFYVDEFQVSPNKHRKILGPDASGAKLTPKKPTIQILQNPTPEKSRGIGTSSTTASKPDHYYKIPERYSFVETVRTLGAGGQARAVLVRTGGKLHVAKFFKKEKYCIREARIIKQIHERYVLALRGRGFWDMINEIDS